MAITKRAMRGYKRQYSTEVCEEPWEGYTDLLRRPPSMLTPDEEAVDVTQEYATVVIVGKKNRARFDTAFEMK